MKVEKVKVTNPQTIIRIDLTPQEAYELGMSIHTRTYSGVAQRLGHEIANTDGVEAREVEE